jgi:hypothetical protein
LPEDAEAAARDGVERQLAVLLFAEHVVAVAEEREVIVRQPGEEGLRLRGFGLWYRELVWVELGGCLECPFAHLQPVIHRRSHLVEDLVQMRVHLVELVLVGVSGYLDMDHRLVGCFVVLRRVRRENRREVAFGVSSDQQDRVDDHAHPEPAPVQLHADAVDQERHVVRDDLDGRVR